MSPHTTTVPLTEREDTTVTSGAAAPDRAHIGLGRLLLFAMGGLAVGGAAQILLRPYIPQQVPSQDNFARVAPVASASAALKPPVSDRRLPTTQVRADPLPRSPAVVPSPGASPTTVEAAALDVDLLVAGEVYSTATSRLALPTGTRFQLSVRADQAGTLVIHAVNPDGQQAALPLWKASIEAGQAVKTDGLRLTGTRGLETLQVVLLAADGRVAGHRQVQIWHL